MKERDFDELSAGHALHALSAEDERAYREALAARPDREIHTRTDLETAALLADATEPVAPPAELRDRLLARISNLPQTGAQHEPDDVVEPPADEGGGALDGEDWIEPNPQRPSRSGRLWFALAAALALIVAVGAGITVFMDRTQTDPAVVALERIESADDAQAATVAFGDGGTATAHWSPSLGDVVLVSDGLPELPADRDFELWFVRDGTPISAGVFTADGDRATAQLTGEMHAGDVIAVTIEPAGGSPTGDPTGEAVVAIPTA